jgi:ATP-binding cassette subfamily G (WHITE) protein 2 (SNQ2)
VLAPHFFSHPPAHPHPFPLSSQGFGNFSEMAVIVEGKHIAQKHVAAGTFPPTLYVLASCLAHVPVAIIEVSIFTGIIYFMSGMTPTVGGYFFFFLVILLQDLCFRNIIAAFSYVGRSVQAAQAMPMPLISILIVFAGFLVTADKMKWLKFMSYVDVFGE